MLIFIIIYVFYWIPITITITIFFLIIAKEVTLVVIMIIKVLLIVTNLFLLFFTGVIIIVIIHKWAQELIFIWHRILENLIIVEICTEKLVLIAFFLIGFLFLGIDIELISIRKIWLKLNIMVLVILHEVKVIVVIVIAS